LELFAQTWLPDDKPKAVLAFAHGQSDHSGRYEHVGQALADAGYALHMADLRGHGHSPGERGHIMSFEDYLADFQAMLDYAHKVAPGKPQFFGGHSMGSTIALYHALQNPSGYSGIVASAPWLRLGFKPPAWKVALGRAISGIIPGLTMGNELDPAWLSHDVEIVEAYANDPLVHRVITARAYTEITGTGEHILAHAGEIQVPLLVVNGREDPIFGYHVSEEFIEQVQIEDRKIIIYEGMFHEVFNEIEHKQVLRDVIAWMDAHC
jgi:alpha-beta hydrolase superfamily lysophospholipase